MRGEPLQKWVLGAGIFNLASASLLAVPSLSPYQYALLNALNQGMGLGGDVLVTPDGGINKLFVNTAGLMLCSVGLMLLYAAGDLNARGGIAVLNALTRVLWSAVVVHYVMTQNVARIMLAFVLSDMIFASAILYYWARRHFVR